MMLHLFGAFLPPKRKVEYALREIYGIGPYSAAKLCHSLNFPKSAMMKDLSREQIIDMMAFIRKNFKFGGEFRKEVRLNIQRLVGMSSYRGIRHNKGLPVRGQRTRTNARTQKSIGKGRLKAPAFSIF